MFRVRIPTNTIISKEINSIISFDGKEDSPEYYFNPEVRTTTIMQAVKNSSDIITEKLIENMIRKRQSVASIQTDYSEGGKERVIIDFYVLTPEEYTALERKIELLDDLVRELKSLINI